MVPGRPSRLRLLDHLQDGARLGAAVRVALVLEHVVLRLHLAGIAGALAGQDVDGVRVAVGVGAAAEAVLPFVFVDLAGEQVLVRREAFIRLDNYLISPLGWIALELDRARDRAAGALG